MKDKIVFLLSATLLLTGLTVFAQDTAATKKLEQMAFNNPLTMSAPSPSTNINMHLQSAYTENIAMQKSAEYRETVYKPCEVQIIGDFFDNASYNLKTGPSIAHIYQFMQNCDNITIEGQTSKGVTNDTVIADNNKRLSFDRAMEIAKLLQEEAAKNGVAVSISPESDGLGEYAKVKSSKKVSSWPTQRNTLTNPANATQNIKISGVGDKYANFQRPALQPGQKAFSKEEEKTFRWYEAQDRKIIIKGTIVK